MTGILLTGCGSKKKNAEDESVIKISMAPEPTATPDPKTVDPDAVTTNGNLTMVNEYLAENGGAALGTDAVTPTPAASDGSGDNTDETGSDSTSGMVRIHPIPETLLMMAVMPEMMKAVMIPAMEIPRSMTKLTVMRVQRKETWMKNKAKKPMELYVHIPFCVKKCDYCDFLSGPAGKERQREYFQSLGREIAAVPEIPDREITTVFIGGGTPSVPDPALMGAILDKIRNKFFMAPDAEITIEANPGFYIKKNFRNTGSIE